MVHIYAKKCAGDGCSKQPSFGVAGSKKAKYCTEHALEGMIDVSAKTSELRYDRQEGRVLCSVCFGGNGRRFSMCGKDGFSKIPSYGVADRKRE